jgi:hypothetical protein
MTSPIGLTDQRNRSLPQVVYKYQITIGDSLQLYWPPGSHVTLSRVAPGNNRRTVEFWLTHTTPTSDPNLNDLWLIDMDVYATGQPIPGNFDVVSTCVDDHLGLVWHLVIARGD